MTVLVPSYEAGIEFFSSVLDFEVLEDTDLGGGKRWVRVAPAGAESALLLAVADTDAQRSRVGSQTGGRVMGFVETADFAADHARFSERGLEFREAPRREPYGTVAVFADPWGGLWDLIEYA